MFFGPDDAHWDLPDEMGEDWFTGQDFHPAPNPKTCRRCGRGDLYWGISTVGKWVLIDIHGKRHVCDPLAVIQMEFGCNGQQ